MRDKTHKGAHCLPCKRQAEAKGTAINPAGTCLAQIDGILTHVKGCMLRPQADRNLAAVELKKILDRVKGTKRDAPMASGNTSGNNSDSSSASAAQSNKKQKTHELTRFMTLEDKPLNPDAQQSFEQQCLKATISANLPLSAWDDDEFKKAFTAVRPKLKVPTRRIMSGRILDKGAENATAARNAIIAGSQGMCYFLDMCCVACLFEVWTHHVTLCNLHSTVAAGVGIASDSWTSPVRQNIMSFVIITSDRKVRA